MYVPGAFIFLVFTIVLVSKFIEFLKDKIADYKTSKNDHKIEYSDFDFIDALNNRVFDEFKLPEAVAFLKDSQFVPGEGYVIDDLQTDDGRAVKRITISASEGNVFPLFSDLLAQLNETVTVISSQIMSMRNYLEINIPEVLLR